MKRNVFLALSFTKRRKVEKVITKFFENKGFEVITGRKIRNGMNQDKELIRLIKDCDFGIVVYNELRHNISYEWGLLSALIDKEGHIFLFKDENIHIDLPKELSDKNGVNFAPFYGEDDEKDIIKSLEENEGLINMMETCIRKSISSDRTKPVAEAAEAIFNINLPTKPMLDDKGEIISDTASSIKDLENLKDKLSKITNLTVEGRFYKSLTYFYMGKLEQAEIDMKKAIDLDPEIAVLYGNHGVILSKLGRDEEAESELRTALILDPEDYHSHFNLGIILTKLNRLEEAKTEIEKGISLDSENALGYALLGAIIVRLEKYTDAEAVLLKSIGLDPNLEIAHAILGALYIDQGRMSEGEDELKKTLILNPKDVSTLIELGHFYINTREYLNAEKELKSAINLDPDNALAHCTFGILLSKLDGRESEAKNEFKIALDLGKNDILVKANYGNYLIEKKLYEEAKLVFNEIKKFDPDNFLSYVNLAFILDKQGREEEAKKEYEIAFNLKPNDLNIIIQFGAFLIKWGFITDAKKIHLKGLEVYPNNPILLQNISELYILLNDFKKSYVTAKKGFKNSEKLKNKVINKFLMHISEILMGNNPDDKLLISFFKENQGCDLNFEFETLKSHLKTSNFYDRIEKLILELKKYFL